MGVHTEGRADGGPGEGADEVRWINPGMVERAGEWKVLSVSPIQFSWVAT